MTEGRTYYVDCRFMLDIKFDMTHNYARCGKWNVCPSCRKYTTEKHPDLHQSGCPYYCPDFEKKGD